MDVNAPHKFPDNLGVQFLDVGVPLNKVQEILHIS